MFAILSRLRRSKRVHDTAAQTASAAVAQFPDRQHDGAPIVYRHDLVDELKREHRLLEVTFALLVEAHRSDDFDTCVASLRAFTNTLRAHLLKENLQLYRYLQYAFRANREAASRMASLRAEMHAIGRALSDFTTDYLGSTWDRARRRRLGQDLLEIGRILNQRIATEEDALYPLYLPPDRY